MLRKSSEAAAFWRLPGRARTAQVGSYAFTTLRPQLGTLTDNALPECSDFGSLAGGPLAAAAAAAAAASSFDVRSSGTSNRGVHDTSGSGAPRVVLADLPGLVLGAHAGRGRGTKFLAHLDRARCIALVLDLTGGQQCTAMHDADPAEQQQAAPIVPHLPTEQLAILQVSGPYMRTCAYLLPSPGIFVCTSLSPPLGYCMPLFMPLRPMTLWRRMSWLAMMLHSLRGPLWLLRTRWICCHHLQLQLR